MGDTRFNLGLLAARRERCVQVVVSATLEHLPLLLDEKAFSPVYWQGRDLARGDAISRGLGWPESRLGTLDFLYHPRRYGCS